MVCRRRHKYNLYQASRFQLRNKNPPAIGRKTATADDVHFGNNSSAKILPSINSPAAMIAPCSVRYSLWYYRGILSIHLLMDVVVHLRVGYAHNDFSFFLSFWLVVANRGEKQSNVHTDCRGTLQARYAQMRREKNRALSITIIQRRAKCHPEAVWIEIRKC